MRGLLDAWNGMGDDTKGALMQGLLAGGFGALAGRGTRLQAIGQGGLAGLLGYNNAINQQQERQQQAQAQQFRDLQMQQMRGAVDDQQRARQVQEQIRGAAQASLIPAQLENTSMEGPVMPTPAGFDTSRFLDQVTQIDPLQGLQLRQQFAPKPADYKVVGDALVQIGPDGVSEAYRAPEKAPALPSAVQEYQFAQKQGYKGSFQDWLLAKARAGASSTTVSYGSPVAGVDAQGNPVFFQPSKDGGTPAIVPGVAPPKPDRPMTESQAKAATFQSQMEAAERELKGTPIDQTRLGSQVDVGLAGGLTNFIASPAAQRARQAQEQWAEAFLRFKTGAAATKDEVLLNVRTFFPQPGDSRDVVQQKERMRQQAMSDIQFAAAGKAPAPAKSDGVRRFNPATGRIE